MLNCGNLIFQVEQDEEVRTSGRRGVGGAQDGDGLGSSVGAGERLEVAEGRPPRFTEAVETWPPQPPRKDKDEL
jgi:hypothetical protein